MQEALNQIVALYDRIDLYELGTHRVSTLYRDVYEPRYEETYGHFEDLVARYADEMIIPEDKAAFKKFYSETHLRGILEHKEPSDHTAVLFHKRMPDGERCLRLHYLIPFHVEGHDYVISCIQTIDEKGIGAALASLA